MAAHSWVVHLPRRPLGWSLGLKMLCGYAEARGLAAQWSVVTLELKVPIPQALLTCWIWRMAFLLLSGPSEATGLRPHTLWSFTLLIFVLIKIDFLHTMYPDYCFFSTNPPRAYPPPHPPKSMPFLPLSLANKRPLKR